MKTNRLSKDTDCIQYFNTNFQNVWKIDCRLSGTEKPSRDIPIIRINGTILSIVQFYVWEREENKKKKENKQQLFEKQWLQRGVMIQL